MKILDSNPVTLMKWLKKYRPSPSKFQTNLEH